MAVSHLQHPARSTMNAGTISARLVTPPDSLGHQDGLCLDSASPVLIRDELLTNPASQLHPVCMPDLMTAATSWEAHGSFTVTNDITRYTRAAIFAKVGQQTPIQARFSSTTNDLPDAHALPLPLGFAVRFQTTDGDWDVVGLNTPVFFIGAPHKFPALLATRQSHTGPFITQAAWEFWSQAPESLHQLTILMSDQGRPGSARFMDGFGGHTYSFWNARRERFWVKFHFKHQQGQQAPAQQATLAGFSALAHAQADLYEAIDRGAHPAWTLYIQVMPEADAAHAPHDPFDLTTVWAEADHPLIEVGVMRLTRKPASQSMTRATQPLSPSHLVPGIGHSPDPMLQARIFSCTDTMPALAQNPANMAGQTSAHTSARPATRLGNTFNQTSGQTTQANAAVRQAGAFFCKLDAAHQRRLAANIARSLKDVSAPTRQRQLALFDQAAPWYGQRVREALADA